MGRKRKPVQPEGDVPVVFPLADGREGEGPPSPATGMSSVEDYYRAETALAQQKQDKLMEQAAKTDPKLAEKLLRRQRKQNAMLLYEKIEKGEARVVEKGAAILSGETIKEYAETLLLGLAIVLGKRPAEDLGFGSLENACERLAKGLNKVSPDFAVQLEEGGGYADLAVGVAGVGKRVWDAVVADKPEKKLDEGDGEKRSDES